MRSTPDFLSDRNQNPSLEIEFRSLAAKYKTPSGVQAWAQNLLSNLAGSDEPKIWQTSDRAGNISWHVYDPTSQDSTVFGSESEVRHWLEQRYR